MDAAQPSSKNLGVLILVLIGIVVLAASFWWFLGGNKMALSPGVKVNVVTIMYTPDGFEPAAVTIRQGTTVTFLDRDGTGMFVASDPHPAHSGYAGTPKEKHCPDASGLSFDQCAKGIMYSFTFQKTGTWSYHNHEHPEAVGSITVTQ